MWIKKIMDSMLGISASSADISLHKTARYNLSEGASVTDSRIILEAGTELVIGKGAQIKNYKIHVKKGRLVIGDYSILTGVQNSLTNSIYIENGTLNIGDHCIIQSEFCIRYGGECKVGSYSGIMYGSEIRCDELLYIGSFNMISYDCMIFDTNTHCQYPFEVRRKMTMESFPNIGAENEKPETSAVIIGDDCWIGKRAVVLKGVTIGDRSTLAACAVATKTCPPDSLLYGNPAVVRAK